MSTVTNAEQSLNTEVRALTSDIFESLRRSAMKQYGFGTDVMKKTKVCTYCGAKLSADAKTCTECGGEATDRTLFDVYKEHHTCCAYCDTVLAENARYCPQCGCKVEIPSQTDLDKITE